MFDERAMRAVPSPGFIADGLRPNALNISRASYNPLGMTALR
jgi:hypothetical protein